MERMISLSDGTGMGDSLFIFHTNAPAEELKKLERTSCDIYKNGGCYEDVPRWKEVLEEKGYSFEYVDEHYHVTPFGTSDEWIEEKYPTITEHYAIENQPE